MIFRNEDAMDLFKLGLIEWDELVKLYEREE